MDYRDPMEIYAIIFGYLIRTFGKIQMSKVNKIALELGYDRVNVDLIKQYADEIEEDPHLEELLDKAIAGEITPDQLKKYNTDTKPIDSEEDMYNVLTPYMVSHEKVLKNNREFRDAQRKGAFTKTLFDDLKKDMKELLEGSVFSNGKPFEYEYTPSDKTLVVVISDWHIGSTVEDHSYHGGYDYSVLTARLKYLLQEVKNKVGDTKAEKIVCLFVGDLIEGADMRGGQKWQLEFDLSEQISKATRTMINFLNELTQMAPTEFAAVRGNHDRMTGQANKKDNIYNDSAVYIVLDTLKLTQEVGGLPNLKIHDNSVDMYNSQVEVYGKLIQINHGDALKGKGPHFDKFVEDRAINYLITGHVHNFQVHQHHKDHLHLVVGSPMGYNNYAKELHLTKTSPSQIIMVLSPDGYPEILPVFMDHIKRGQEDNE